MKSVIENEYTLIIKNSRFICQLYQINTEDDVKYYLDMAKDKYPNATHYCYAYILDNIRRESDDNEPSGTAGIPMMQVLDKNNLNKVLCIVIRYFGKIKLGAGGLVRAYSKVVSECLKDHIIYLKKGYYVRITFPYSVSKKIDYILSNTKIFNKFFKENIIYEVIVDDDTLNILKSECNVEVINDTYIYE